MTRFRVATYNVHKCKGLDWRVNLHRIANVIKQFSPHLLAAQEITLSQAQAIALELNLPMFFGGARLHNGEPYGNAVLTIFPVLSSESYDLSISPYEPRQCLRVTVALAQARPLHFFSVHLGTAIAERRQQARVLLSAQVLESSAFTGARIVAGDFNEWKRGITTQLLNEYLQSADIWTHLKRRTTYPGALPFLHLDHIYYDPAFQLCKMHLHRSRLALIASDHLPLIADFQLP